MRVKHPYKHPIAEAPIAIERITQAPLIRIGSNRNPVPANVQVIDKNPYDTCGKYYTARGMNTHKATIEINTILSIN